MKFNYVTNSKVKYVHTEEGHNTKAANVVVPIVNELLFDSGEILNGTERLNNVEGEFCNQSKLNRPLKVVDFGCGLGTWLKVFKDHGASEVLGIDGKWVNRELLHKYITEQEFREADMEKPVKLDKTYDLVVSLEVAEHLSEQSADIFVQFLVDAGKIILFSAAIPGQGGWNHVNEQWPDYWQKKFSMHGYIYHDLIRGHVWGNPAVGACYQQNMFIVAHESVKINAERVAIYALVHPDYLISALNRLDGEIGIVYGLKLFLKGIVWKFRKHVLKRKSHFKPWRSERD